MDQRGILLVDDEALALKYFSKALGRRFPIYSASSAAEALQVLDAHASSIGAVVTDQRMPEATGVELLTIVRNKYPDTARILTTAYSDFDVLVSAINVGAVHSFVAKPWNIDELERTLLEALGAGKPGGPDSSALSKGEMPAPPVEERAYDIGLIAARLGHYVHNALCPMTFLLDQLIARKPLDQVCSLEFLHEVRDHVNDVSRTLKELEQATMPLRDRDREVMDLREIFTRTLAGMDSLCDRRQLRIEARIPADLPVISGWAGQIEKMFRFLIAEEAVSLPAGSQVRVAFSRRMENEECTGIDIEVEDFVPISAEVDPANLLLPFCLRGGNPREFGVFLAACYFIARHHGGTFEAQRKENEGLRFRIFLPSGSRESDPRMTDFLGKPSPVAYNEFPRHDS